MTATEMKSAMRRITREFKSSVEAEVRRRWREEMKLIYVREYTVKAHLRKMRPRRRGALPMRYRLRLASGRTKRLEGAPASGVAGLSNDPSLHTRWDVAYFLSKISWSKGAPLPAMFEVEDIEPDSDDVNLIEVRLIATIRVRDRDTGKPLSVDGSESLVLPASTAHVFQRVVGLLVRLWNHELAESLLMEGIRLLDPHKDTK